MSIKTNEISTPVQLQRMFDDIKRDFIALQKRATAQTQRIEKLCKAHRESNRFDKLDRGNAWRMS